MAIEVTTRHLEIGDAVKAQARDKAAKLIEKFPDIEHAHIVIDKDGPLHTAALTIQGGQNGKTEAEAKKSGVLEALQEAFDKAEAQLRKHSQRQHEVRK